MNEFGLVVVTPPADELVSLAEAKEQCNVEADFTDDDALLERMIAAARRWCEREVKRAFVTQTLRIYLDAFVDEIVLPRPPLIAVSSVKYVDTAGVLQTLAASGYQVSSGREPARIWTAYSKSWPSVRSQRQAVQVEYTAGYGDPEDVPAEAGLAVQILVAQMYRFREAEITGTIVSAVGFSVKSLLGSLKYGYRW